MRARHKLMDIQPIETEQENDAALRRIDKLWDAEPGTCEGKELEVLVQRVVAFEDKEYPM